MKSLKILVFSVFLMGLVFAESRADLVLDYTDGSPVIGWQLPHPQGAIHMAMYYTNQTTVACTLKTVHVGLVNDPGLFNDTTGDLFVTIYKANADGFPFTDSLLYFKSVPNADFVSGYDQPINVVSLDVSLLGLTFPTGGQWIVAVTTDQQSVSSGNVLIFASDQGTKPSQRWLEYNASADWQRANCCHGGIDVNMHIYSTISTPANNQPPVLKATPDLFVDERDSLNFGVSATDADGDQINLSMFSDNLPATATFIDSGNGVGAFNWATDYFNAGVYTVVFKAEDGNGGFDEDTVEITVNNVEQPPIIYPIGDQFVDENQLLEFYVYTDDSDGDLVQLGIFNSDLPSEATFQLLEPGFGIFSWQTNYDDAGIYYAVFGANDGKNLTTDSISITVRNIACPDLTVSEFSLSGPPFVSKGINLNNRLITNVTNIGDANSNDTVFAGFYISTDSIITTSDQLLFGGREAVGQILQGAVVNVRGGGIIPVAYSDGPAFLGVIIDDFFTTAECNEANNFAFIPVNVVLNVPPLLDPINDTTIDEGEALILNISGFEPDGEPFHFEVSNAPKGFGFTDNGNGTATFEWAPGFGESGNYVVTFAIVDDRGERDEQDVNITVNDVNQPPQFEFVDDQFVTEGITLEFFVSAVDFDFDPVALSYSSPDIPVAATFVDNGGGNGTFNWTPSFLDAGEYLAIFTADDGRGGMALDSVLITVYNSNQPPVLDFIGDRSVSEDDTLIFFVTASDLDDEAIGMSIVDSDLPTYDFVPVPSKTSFQTYQFTFVPGFDDSGTYTATFVAYDETTADSETISIHVSNINRPPDIKPVSDQFIAENNSLIFNVNASDPDGDAISISAFGLPPGASFFDSGNGAATFNWIPGFDDAGIYQVVLRVEDFAGDFDVDTFAINVANTNRPPQLNPINDTAIAENQALHLEIAATDPDGGNVALSVLGVPAGAIFIDFANNTGSFDWTPTFEQSGDYSVVFVVSDGSDVDLDTVRISVNPVNRPPVLDPIGAQSFVEKQYKQFSVNGSDPDGDSLTFSSTALPEGSLFHQIAVGGAIFEWTPDITQFGEYLVTFYISDGTETDSEQVLITVTDVPCPDFSIEVFSIDDPQQISFERLIQNRLNLEIQNSGEIDINDSVAIEFFVSEDSSLLNCDCNVEPIGFQYVNSVPLGNQFDVPVVEDLLLTAQGSISQGPRWLCATIDRNETYGDCDLSNNYICIPIEVGYNIDPVLDSIGDKQVNEGETLSFFVTASDADGDELYIGFNFYDPTLVNYPTISDSGNGRSYFEWTPSFDDDGIYNFEFYVGDNYEASDYETITIVVDNVNRAPQIDSLQDSIIVNENEFISFNVYATDPDDDCVALSLVSPDLQADSLFTDYGDCANYGVFEWTPGYADAGIYHAVFLVDDLNGGIDQDTVVIIIRNINAKPLFDEIPFQLGYEDSLLSFQISAFDIDGNLDSIYSEPLPVGASFIYNGNGTGTFTWTPDCNQSGEYPFRCFAVDDSGLVDTGYIGMEILENCTETLSVVTTPCVECAPPAFYTDILVSDGAFSIVFNNYFNESSIKGNVFISSARGLTVRIVSDNKNKALSLQPPIGLDFFPSDTIRVTLTTGIVDLGGVPLDSGYNLTYFTGPVVYPGDCNNDGTVNEVDVLSIGLFWNEAGPDRNVGGEYSLLDFFAQPAHFQEQAHGEWNPRNGVYADVDGSGMVDADDLCGIATNFAMTVNEGSAAKSGSNLANGSALSELGSKVLEQMRGALIECPDSAPKTKMLEAIENALRAATVILPTEIELHQNYPNPFNPSTTIEFFLPKAEYTTLSVYNMLGQQVVTLIDEKVEAGYKTVLWNGTDNWGHSVASGIYFYKLNTESKEIIKRMLLVK